MRVLRQAATDVAEQTINNSWQQVLARGFTSPRLLLKHLGLDNSRDFDAINAERQFSLKVTQRFVAKMKKGDSSDPLLRQVLPIGEEMTITPGYSNDPLVESDKNPLPGLLHKYHGRVLLTLSSACAINCRYCFRRHFPYRENLLTSKTWPAVLAYLANDESISEVILSGGDPMLINNRQLAKFISQIEAISHITTLRIHSRLPIVLPERFDDGWFDCFTDTRLHKVMVLHCNHAAELDDDIAQLCLRLHNSGFHLLNQTVLLGEINDSVSILSELSKSLFGIGVLPYYLHLLDKVVGSAHFDVDEKQAYALHQQLKALLPGYLVPKLVRENAGVANKSWIERL